MERTVWEWMKRCPVKPAQRLEAGFLPVGGGLALLTAEPERRTKRFILGGCEAAYTFALVYRLAAATTEERLQADETLDNMGAWAEERENWPELGEGVKVLSVRCDEAAKLVDRYENDLEDHRILITLTYERI